MMGTQQMERLDPNLLGLLMQQKSILSAVPVILHVELVRAKREVVNQATVLNVFYAISNMDLGFMLKPNKHASHLVSQDTMRLKTNLDNLN